VPGDARLLDMHAIDNIADGALAGFHCLDNVEPGWFAKSVEEVYLRFHVYTLVCIFIGVNSQSTGRLTR
jgi:hypothetical protein